MKRFKNISQKWRKLTVVLLLLNFIITPVISAFPQEECSGTCEMMSKFHECNTSSMKKTEMKNSCCDMMEMNSKTNSVVTTKCGMKFSDINCSLIIVKHINTTYTIPKTVDSIVDFVILPMLNVERTISTTALANYSQEISLDSSPPIYLMISSFLN